MSASRGAATYCKIRPVCTFAYGRILRGTKTLTGSIATMASDPFRCACFTDTRPFELVPPSSTNALRLLGANQCTALVQPGHRPELVGLTTEFARLRVMAAEPRDSGTTCTPA